MDLCSHKHDFGVSAECISAPCDGIGGLVKTTCSQTKPPKVLPQIFDYETIVDLHYIFFISNLGLCLELGLLNSEAVISAGVAYLVA